MNLVRLRDRHELVHAGFHGRERDDEEEHQHHDDEDAARCDHDLLDGAEHTLDDAREPRRQLGPGLWCAECHDDRLDHPVDVEGRKHVLHPGLGVVEGTVLNVCDDALHEFGELADDHRDDDQHRAGEGSDHHNHEGEEGGPARKAPSHEELHCRLEAERDEDRCERVQENRLDLQNCGADDNRQQHTEAAEQADLERILDLHAGSQHCELTMSRGRRWSRMGQPTVPWNTASWTRGVPRLGVSAPGLPPLKGYGDFCDTCFLQSALCWQLRSSHWALRSAPSGRRLTPSCSRLKSR